MNHVAEFRTSILLSKDANKEYSTENFRTITQLNADLSVLGCLHLSLINRVDDAT